jgi:hypothetical protein
MTAPASAPALAHVAAARSLPAAAPSRASLRALGAVAMLCAPSSLALWTPPAKTDLRANLFMTAYLLGWACSTVAMRRLRATGRGRGAAAFFAVQIALLALAACQQPQDQLGVHPLGDAFYFASDMAWPLSHLLMLGAFAAGWRARVWDGWRRWTPLACGLALPFTFAVAATRLVPPNAVFCAGTASAFFMLGLAVFTSRPEIRRD